MNIIFFILGLIVGIFLGIKVCYRQCKTLEKQKAELSVMYYKQLDELLSNNEKLEARLRTFEKV